MPLQRSARCLQVPASEHTAPLRQRSAALRSLLPQPLRSTPSGPGALTSCDIYCLRAALRSLCKGAPAQARLKLLVHTSRSGAQASGQTQRVAAFAHAPRPQSAVTEDPCASQASCVLVCGGTQLFFDPFAGNCGHHEPLLRGACMRTGRTSTSARGSIGHTLLTAAARRREPRARAPPSKQQSHKRVPLVRACEVQVSPGHTSGALQPSQSPRRAQAAQLAQQSRQFSKRTLPRSGCKLQL